VLRAEERRERRAAGGDAIGDVPKVDIDRRRVADHAHAPTRERAGIEEALRAQRGVHGLDYTGRINSLPRFSAALALACGLAAAASAQQATFRSGARVVSLFATVVDAQGRLVPDLTKDNFQVFDNDELQPLVLFDGGVQPITVIVMLDTSGSMTASMALLKQAAEQFLSRLLPPTGPASAPSATRFRSALALRTSVTSSSPRSRI